MLKLKGKNIILEIIRLKKITIPDLQYKYNLSYYKAFTIVKRLVEKGVFKYKSGLEYVIVENVNEFRDQHFPYDRFLNYWYWKNKKSN